MEQLENPKHELFAIALIKHKGNQTKAYLETYPDASPESARRSASLLMSKVDVRGRVRGFLEAQGLGLWDINKKLKKLTEAERAVVVGENIIFVPDGFVRIEALKIVYKLHGLNRI